MEPHAYVVWFKRPNAKRKEPWEEVGTVRTLREAVALIGDGRGHGSWWIQNKYPPQRKNA